MATENPIPSPSNTVPRHQCLVYEGSPAPHLPGLAALLRQKLRENYRCLYLNSPPMVAGMRSYLFAAGMDVPKEVTKGGLVLSSDTMHLLNGRFYSDRMLRMLDDAVEEALKDGYRGLWATGDMSWEFGPEKDFSKLLEYEWRLEEFFRTSFTAQSFDNTAALDNMIRSLCQGQDVN